MCGEQTHFSTQHVWWFLLLTTYRRTPCRRKCYNKILTSRITLTLSDLQASRLPLTRCQALACKVCQSDLQYFQRNAKSNLEHLTTVWKGWIIKISWQAEYQLTDSWSSYHKSARQGRDTKPIFSFPFQLQTGIDHIESVSLLLSKFSTLIGLFSGRLLPLSLLLT